MQKKPRHPGDPRKDLLSDHRHWNKVLCNCWGLDKNLYGLLHGVRCGGAGLIQTQKSFRLMPGEWDEPAWEDIRQNELTTYKDELVYVFKLSRQEVK